MAVSFPKMPREARSLPSRTLPLQMYSDAQIRSKSKIQASPSSLPLPDISSELLVIHSGVRIARFVVIAAPKSPLCLIKKILAQRHLQLNL
jgi:hypothetical protein